MHSRWPFYLLALVPFFDVRLAFNIRLGEAIFLLLAGAFWVLRPRVLPDSLYLFVIASLGILTFSVTNSLITIGGPLGIEQIAFLYKYLSLLVWIAAGMYFAHFRLIDIRRYVLVLFAIATIWAATYMQVAAIIGPVGHILGMISSRPDFPFSVGGGHVYATFYTYLFLFAFFLARHPVTRVALALVFVIAVLHTGSRTPLIAITVVFLVRMMMMLPTMRFPESCRIRAVAGAAVGITAGAVAIAIVSGPVIEYVESSSQVGRALKLDFTNDNSTMGRVQAARMGLESFSDSHALGNVLFPYTLWYDNGMIRLMSDFGMLALPILSFIGFLLYKVRHQPVLFYPTAVFLISCLASEHFLVFRSAFFFVFIAGFIGYRVFCQHETVPDNRQL